MVNTVNQLINRLKEYANFDTVKFNQFLTDYATIVSEKEKIPDSWSGYKEFVKIRKLEIYLQRAINFESNKIDSPGLLIFNYAQTLEEITAVIEKEQKIHSGFYKSKYVERVLKKSN